MGERWQPWRQSDSYRHYRKKRIEAIPFCRFTMSRLTQERRPVSAIPSRPVLGTSLYKAYEDSPNIKLKGLVVENSKRPFLVATRGIPAGEDLFFDYGVRPGHFNEGHDLSFLLSERARKHQRDVLMAYAMEEIPKQVSGVSSRCSEPSGTKWWKLKKTKTKLKQKKNTFLKAITPFRNEYAINPL